MEIRYPDYYGKFRCLAGDCPDTCCVGWEIRLDKETRKRYRREAVRRDEMGKKFRKYVRNGHFVPADGFCPFLDGHGLCSICTELGEDAMCKTCRRYPRHEEDYGRLHERLLLLSCPEAVRLVISEGNGEYLVKKRPNRPVSMAGIDEGLLSLLLSMRETLWRIGKNRCLSMDGRLLMALSLGHDAMRRLRAGRPEKILTLLSRYEADTAPEQFLRLLNRREQAESRFAFMADFMEVLSGLSPISPKWPNMLERCRKTLYHEPGCRARYDGEREKFLLENPELTLHWERLFGYFIYSFFLSSLYDGDVYGNVRLAVYCTFAVMELDFAEWRMSSRPVDGWDGKQAEICHVFARQVENSDENRKVLAEVLTERRFGIGEAAAGVPVRF